MNDVNREIINIQPKEMKAERFKMSILYYNYTPSIYDGDVLLIKAQKTHSEDECVTEKLECLWQKKLKKTLKV